MCADFRVKCEVEVRGLTALFLYAAYRRHAVSPVPRRGICEKPRAILPRALSWRIPVFRAGAKPVSYTHLDVYKRQGSLFFENTIAEIAALTGLESPLALRRVLAASRMLSSDVSAGFDPAYASVFETKNAAYLGKGLVFNKYTGARGKSGSNDARDVYKRQASLSGKCF